MEKPNAIKISILDIASSLRMPEMPDPVLVEEKVLNVQKSLGHLPAESLRTLGLWETSKMFNEHESAIEDNLRKATRTFGIDIFRNEDHFLFYPKTYWSQCGSRMQRLKRVVERPSWREHVEHVLRFDLSHFLDDEANIHGNAESPE